MLLEELANRPLPEADNAAILLRRAAESVNATSKAWVQFDTLELALPLTQKEQEAIARVIQENQAALQKLRAERARRAVDWQLDYSRPILSEVPGLKEQKPLADAAAAAILLEHQRTNDREAVELAQDLLAQSNAVEQMPAGLLPHLIGIGISSMACDRIFEIVPDVRIGTGEREVTPAGVKKLIDVLLDETQLRNGQRLAMQMERIYQAIGAQSLRALSPPMTSQQRKGMAVMEYIGKPFMRRDGRLLLQDSTEMMKAAEESADSPAFNDKTKQRVQQMMALRQSAGHLLLGMLGGLHTRPVELTFRSTTARRLAAVALAIRLYQFEHEGKLPAKLDDLVPRYLPAVPGDALGSARKIGYIADPQLPRVYSVGEDATDQNGSDAPRKKGMDSGRWSEEDVVVHLTRRPRKQLD